ncbi:MAG: LemA family protein [Patescibacteria group bacterium]|nr:LemA family protein [Patescibacteria group bacterium]
MTNFLIILATMFFLAIMLLAAAFSIMREYKRKMDLAWDKLDKLLVYRRDVVPYLLENSRIDDGRWKALKDKRIELLKNNISRSERLDLEVQLGNAIEALIAIAREHDEISSNTNFLEAKKDIMVEIDEALKAYEEAEKEYNDKKEKFPYSVAASARQRAHLRSREVPLG